MLVNLPKTKTGEVHSYTLMSLGLFVNICQKNGILKLIPKGK